jgi:hypothetical protein
MTALRPTPGLDAGGLAELPGLETVAGQLAPLITVLRAEQARRKAGIPISRPAWKNVVFAGSPGTGRSRAATALARLYRDLGLLQYGNLIEIPAADLACATLRDTVTLEHPGFGGDSILPRCSGLGGRCLPRYRRMAEPRSDHFSAFVLSNICPAPLSSCPAWWRGLRPPGPPPGRGHLLVGHPFCAAGSPGWARGDAQRHRLRRRRRP